MGLSGGWKLNKNSKRAQDTTHISPPHTDNLRWARAQAIPLGLTVVHISQRPQQGSMVRSRD